jgi:WD40 repeat protein
VWNPSDRKKIDHLEVDTEDTPFAVAFSPKGEHLVSGHGDGTVAFWRREGDGKFRAATKAREHQDWVYDLAFSNDGRRLVSASKDGTIVVWDLESLEPVIRDGKGPFLRQVLRAHKNEVRSVMFSRDGRSFVSAGYDNSLILWDVDAPAFWGHRVDAHGDEPLSFGNPALRSLAFRPDGKTIVSGSEDGTLKIWDAATPKSLTDATDRKRDEVLSVAFSPDGKLIVSGRKSGALTLSDGATLTVLRESPMVHKGGTLTVAFSPDGKTLLSGGEDHKLRSWNPGTLQPHPGDPASGHDGPVRTIAFSPDGTSIASAGDDKIVRFWAAPGLKRIGETPRRHDRRVNSVAFDPSGRILASAGNDGTIVLWDVGTRQPLGEPLRGHRQSSFWNGVTSLSFSRDGRMLASGAGDKTLILWDVETRLPLDPLLGHTKEVLAVAFSPDGRTLVSGDGNGDLFFWDVDPESWVRKLCAKLTRNLSRSEWDTYVGKNVPYQEQCRGLPQ